MYATYSVKDRGCFNCGDSPLKRGSGRGIYRSWHDSLFLSPLNCELYFKSPVFSRWNVIVLPVFMIGVSNQYAWLGKKWHWSNCSIDIHISSLLGFLSIVFFFIPVHVILRMYTCMPFALLCFPSTQCFHAHCIGPPSDPPLRKQRKI